jgi:hypothetical protein
MIISLQRLQVRQGQCGDKNTYGGACILARCSGLDGTVSMQ